MRNGRTPQPGIRRAGKGKYTIRVTSRDPGTRRRWELERTVEAENLTAAIAEREKLRAELVVMIEQARPTRPPRAVDATGMTLTAYAQLWLKHVVRTGRNRMHVVKRNADRLEREILPLLGEVPLGDIDGRTLSWWMEEIGERRKADGSPYARQTLHTAWGILRCMLRDAVVLAGLAKDPTAGLRFRVKGTPPQERDALTVDEIAALLSAAQDESFDVQVMMWLGFTTGARFGELTALTWGDIDFERGVVTIRRSQVKGEVGTTKTGKRREVPLHARTAALLQELRRQQIERQVRGLEKGLVFPSSQGGYRYNSMLTRPMKRCAVTAGVRKAVTTHTMRRSFNNLSRQVAGEIVTRAMVGHSTEAMTAHYSVISLDEKRAALDAALGQLGQKDGGGGNPWWEPPQNGGVSTGG